MKIIFKYSIPLGQGIIPFEQMMPRGAKVIHVAMQDQKPQMWAEVDNLQPMEKKFFMIVATGRILPAEGNWKHVGTFLEGDQGQYVWHIYQLQRDFS